MGAFKNVTNIKKEHESEWSWWGEYLETTKDLVRDVHSGEGGGSIPPKLIGIDLDNNKLYHYPVLDFFKPKERLDYRFLVNSMMFYIERKGIIHEVDISEERAEYVVSTNEKRCQEFFDKNIHRLDIGIKDLCFECFRFVLEEKDIPSSFGLFDSKLIPNKVFEGITRNDSILNIINDHETCLVSTLEVPDKTKSDIKVIPYERRAKAIVFDGSIELEGVKRCTNRGIIVN